MFHLHCPKKAINSLSFYYSSLGCLLLFLFTSCGSASGSITSGTPIALPSGPTFPVQPTNPPTITVGPGTPTPTPYPTPGVSFPTNPNIPYATPTHISISTTPTPMSTPIPPTSTPIPPTPLPTRLARQFYEAEAVPPNILTGGAQILNCGGCSGGQRVGHLDLSGSSLTFASVATSVAGNYQLTVAYSCTDPRTILVSINGGSAQSMSGLTSPSFDNPSNFTITVSLNQGYNTVRFFSDGSHATPDIDAIQVG